MKLNMILLVLLLAGNAQLFAAIKDIPSMKPAEIVKLDYAALSEAEQKSLWFTAMFTGLQINKRAARQVISKEFPAVKWQDIEGIALSAKQANKIDDGIAQAQATVGITRTSDKQTIPSKATTPLVVKSPPTKQVEAQKIPQAPDKPTIPSGATTPSESTKSPLVKPPLLAIDTAAQPQGKPLQPIATSKGKPAMTVITDNGELLEPVVNEQQSNKLTMLQVKELEDLLKQAEDYYNKISKLNPKQQAEEKGEFNVPKLREDLLSSTNKDNFSQNVNKIKKEINKFKDRLEFLEKIKKLLDELIKEIKRNFDGIYSIDSKYRMDDLPENMKNYDNFKIEIDKIQKKEGVEGAYKSAQNLNSALLLKLIELEGSPADKQQEEELVIDLGFKTEGNNAQNNKQSDDLARILAETSYETEKTRELVNIAEGLNQLIKDITATDPQYEDRENNYVNYVHREIHRGVSNETILKALHKAKQDLENILSLVKQKYRDYMSYTRTIELYKNDLKKYNKRIPSMDKDFDDILSNHGLNAAIRAQEAYIQDLKEALKK